MKNTIKLTLAIFFLVCSIDAIGQIRRGRLVGEWKTNNQDSLYYQKDSINFYLNPNHRLNIETCQLLTWRIEKKKFKVINSYICSEPGTLSWINVREKIKLKKQDYGQILQLIRANTIIDRFKVISSEVNKVDRYPYEIKQLTILRFDKLEDHKLYKFVDSLVYEVLDYKPKGIDSAFYKKITENAAATIQPILIRDQRESNPKPLLIINGIPIESYEILKHFLLVEAIAIKYLTKEQATSLYGARALNGVIVLQVSNKKFKKLTKKNGGQRGL